MPQIIDLDDLLGDDKRVRLNKKVYVLPPDLPVDLYLEINRFAREQKSEAEMFEALYERVLQLFRYKDPNVQELPISLGQLMAVISRVYGDGGDDAAPPPRPAGTRSSSRRRTSSQRSS